MHLWVHTFLSFQGLLYQSPAQFAAFQFNMSFMHFMSELEASFANSFAYISLQTLHTNQYHRSVKL
jgi:hypothetical protein